MRFVKPGSVSGSLSVPTSKSITQRALLAASLADGPSKIDAPSRCADTDAALEFARALGADVVDDYLTVRIDGRRRVRDDVLHCGESATLLRLGAAVAALDPRPCELEAAGTLRRRPMGMVADGLTAFGANVDAADFPPLRIAGGLAPGRHTVDGSASSQHLSGLMLALPTLPGDSVIDVANPASVGYLRITEAVAARFGVTCAVSADGTRLDIPGGQSYTPAHLEVPEDWSSAAWWIVAGALTGGVHLPTLRTGTGQPDEAIVELCQSAGLDVTEGDDGVRARTSEPSAFEFDATNTPDLVPVVAVLAAVARGTSRIDGVSRLRTKESDRLAMCVEHLSTLGVATRVDVDALWVDGGALSGGSLRTDGDHRMAMAGTLAGLLSGCGVTLDDGTCVAKSYPHFFDDVDRLRA